MAQGYRFDPELAEFAAMAPVPGPAAPDSGVAEAVAQREQARTVMSMLGESDLSGLVVEEVRIPGLDGAPDVPALVYRPEALIGTGPGIVQIHGGGFSSGSIFGDMEGASGLARAAGIVVVTPEYRLAPEHPAPAAVEDCYATLCWVHANAERLELDPARIAIGGGSAGGGIAAGLALMARDRGGPAICFQFLMIPELDHRLETPSMRQFDDTPMWNRHAAEQSWRWYLGAGHDGDVSPYASPSIAPDLTGLPPAYVSAMEFDPLRDEAIHYALRLLEAGVSVELHSFPGTFHGSALVTTAAVSKRESAERLAVMRRALGLDAVSS